MSRQARPRLPTVTYPLCAGDEHIQGKIMKTDMQLKADVTAELAWEPAVNSAGIGVLVNDGVVTLTGHLNTFAEKVAAERAVRRVAGVRGLAIELDVKLVAAHHRSDSEIASVAASALRWSVLLPLDRI